MKARLFVLAACLLLPLSALAQAPFCAVSSGGAQCHFYDLGACHQTLRGVGGQCVANPAALPQPVAPIQPEAAYQRRQLVQPSYGPIDAMRDTQNGFDQGRRAGIEKREHEARMRLLDAQIAAAKPQQSADGLKVTYSCPDKNGGTYEATLPVLGCIVTGIDF